MKKELTKKYDNGEVTVLWQPHKCVHAAFCFRGLPTVFDPRKRPWIHTEGASTKAIMAQVDRCPSGALSYVLNEQQQIATGTEILPVGNLAEGK